MKNGKRLLAAVLSATMMLATVPTAAATETLSDAEMDVVSNGEGLQDTSLKEVSSLLDGDSFCLFEMPYMEGFGSADVTRMFPGGILAFTYGNGAFGYYGLMDDQGNVLIQPERYQEICYAGDFQTYLHENNQVLFLKYAENAFDVFSLRDKEVVAQAMADNSPGNEYFILVESAEGKLGVLDKDGYPIVSCDYDDYEILHDKRIAMYCKDTREYSLFDEEGNLLLDGLLEVNEYNEAVCKVTMESTVPYGYRNQVMIDLDGNVLFDTDQLEVGVLLANRFSDGLIADTSYENPGYFNKAGQKVLWTETRNLGDFVSGRAIANYDSVLFPDGTIKDPHVEEVLYPYYNRYAMSYDYRSGNGNLVSMQAKKMLSSDRYRVGYAGENYFWSPEYSTPHNWIRIYDTTTQKCAYLNTKTNRITSYVYDGNYAKNDIVFEIHGEQFVRVQRNNQVGLLAPNGSELIPCGEYEAVWKAEGYDYFECRNEEGRPYYTLIAPDGQLLTEKDGFISIEYDEESGYALALDSLRDEWIIEPDGTAMLVGDAFVDASVYLRARGFGSGLVSAQMYDSEGMHSYGYMDTDCQFRMLVNDDNPLKDVLSETVTFQYGCAFLTSDTGNYLLVDKTHNHEEDFTYSEPCEDHSDVTVKTVMPFDGTVGVSPLQAEVTMKLSQNCTIEDVKSYVKVSCTTGAPQYSVIQNGNMLYIDFCGPLELGETYGIKLMSAPVTFACGATGTIQEFSSQFTVSGISFDDLLTKYTTYLMRPDDIALIYNDAEAAVLRAADAYAGYNDINKKASAYFYVARNLEECIAHGFMQAAGYDGLDDKLNKDIVRSIIAETCVNNPDAVKNADAMSAALIKYLKRVNKETLKEDLVGYLKDYAEEATMRMSPAVFDGVAYVTEKFREDGEFRQNFGYALDLETDLIAEFSASLLTYVYFNCDAAEQLMAHLSEDSDLYVALSEYVEDLSGTKLWTHVAESAFSDMATEILAYEMKQMTSLLNNIKKLKFEGTMFWVNLLGYMHDTITDNADVTEYAQTFMYLTHTRSLETALYDVIADISNAAYHGNVTEQHKEDLRAVYEAYHVTWMKTLEQAANMFRSGQNPYAQRCLMIRELVEEKCSYEQYIRASKQQAAKDTYKAVLATSAPDTVSGFAEDSVQVSSESVRLLDEMPEVYSVVTRSSYDHLTIPAKMDSDIDYVADDAFCNETVLTSVVIVGSNSGTHIGNNAFSGCGSLESVALGNVLSVGDYAFTNTGLQSILIPESVVFIGEEAFYGVETVCGFNEVAEAHATAIGAEYVDMAKETVELTVVRLPDKCDYSLGEALDLSGLELSCAGEPVDVENCVVSSLKQTIGQQDILIFYSGAIAEIPVTVTESSVSEETNTVLQLLTVEKTKEAVVIEGKITSDKAAEILIACYEADGRMIDAVWSFVETDGLFEAYIECEEAGSVTVFTVDPQSNFAPLLPVVRKDLH